MFACDLANLMMCLMQVAQIEATFLDSLNQVRAMAAYLSVIRKHLTGPPDESPGGIKVFQAITDSTAKLQQAAADMSRKHKQHLQVSTAE
jgi:hypothetical protein